MINVEELHPKEDINSFWFSVCQLPQSKERGLVTAGVVSSLQSTFQRIFLL
jgi:hypothetical protein